MSQRLSANIYLQKNSALNGRYCNSDISRHGYSGKNVRIIVELSANSLHSDLVLYGVPVLTNPNLDILGVRFAWKLTFEAYMRGAVSRVSPRIGILRMVHGVFADTIVCCFVGAVVLSSPSEITVHMLVGCWKLSPSAFLSVRCLR